MDNKMNTEKYMSGMGFYNHLAYGLIRQSKPKVVLEIGLGEGAIGAERMLTALKENSDEGFIGKYFVIEEFPTQQAREVLKRFENISTLIFANSQDYRSHRLPTSADIVFIDGSHDIRSCYNDMFNILVKNQMDTDGIMVVHDVMMMSVRFAIKKICEQFDLNMLVLGQKNMNVCLLTIKN